MYRVNRVNPIKKKGQNYSSYSPSGCRNFDFMKQDSYLLMCFCSLLTRFSRDPHFISLPSEVTRWRKEIDRPSQYPVCTKLMTSPLSSTSSSSSMSSGRVFAPMVNPLISSPKELTYLALMERIFYFLHLIAMLLRAILKPKKSSDRLISLSQDSFTPNS